MGIQLPRWVWLGAGLLAGVAGMVNVVGYLGFEHQAVTHLTGTTTLLGSAVARGDMRAVMHLGGVAVAFMAGAALSGMIIQDSTLRLGRRYGVTLALESVLLLAAIPLFKQQQIVGALLAAMACGVQNAMATTYSGAVIRTSHLSGMFTDLGIGLGHALRGMPLQKRRLLLCGLIIGSFLTGAVVGARLFVALGYDALLVPATLTGVTGLGYITYRHLWAERERRYDAGD
ncbi:membrane protein [Lysobacter daejeonensis GH1-9]|uniref:Membrane protein n=1 Tax=Lysobacter daejeonensis GH1-9 TaxID=1385517 RepID=A0A0A0EXB6_9GAMM|nr:YoaK family protein [Lysobacter daejeonensis]KGM55591.1 membrane protein [Lysobacter daejeonensis GH1-9]